jgi:hypothetical protein
MLRISHVQIENKTHIEQRLLKVRIQVKTQGPSIRYELFVIAIEVERSSLNAPVYDTLILEGLIQKSIQQFE